MHQLFYIVMLCIVVLRDEKKENIQAKRTEYTENHHLEVKKLSWQLLTFLKLYSIKIVVKDKSQLDVMMILEPKLSKLTEHT